MEYGERIAGYSYIVENERVWFMAYGRNYICCYDLKDGSVKNYVVSDKNILNCERQLYHKILNNGEWLLLIPRIAEDVVLFNINSKDCIHIDLPNHKNISNNKFVPDEAKFCSGFVYGDYFFLLGLSFPGILRVSNIDFSIELIDSWVEELNRFIDKEYIGYISLGCYIKKNIATCPLICAQAVLLLNLDTFETSIKTVDGPFTDGIYGLSGSAKEGLWVSGIGHNADVVCQILGDAINTYGIKEISGDTHLFYPPLLTDYGIFLVPVQYEKNIFMFDSHRREFRIWKQFDEIDGIRSITGYSFMEPLVIGDKILIVDGQTYDCHLVECKNSKDFLFYIDVNNNYFEKDFWRKRISLLSSDNQIIEESKMSLGLYLESIGKGYENIISCDSHISPSDRY